MARHESELIPFSPSILLGERLLVLAPHPDDEAIGCGGLIALHVDGDRQIRTVIATDGTAAEVNGTAERETGTDERDYRRRREEESAAGLAILGAPPPLFLRFADRTLSDCIAELAAAIASEIAAFAPDLIAAPQPLEIHPDHVALSRALHQALRTSEPPAPLTTVAFYEVSQPFRPNTIVDISSVASRKLEAIAAHHSQTGLRSYDTFARGLNAYRSMTMPPGVEMAEAYWTIEAGTLRRMTWVDVCRLPAPASSIEPIGEIVPVSVMVRTRNRPQLLREAIESIRANSHPASIIVINDGGESPASAIEEGSDLTLIDLSEPVGRSEAMNRAASAATTEYICFLDDDDLFDQNHIATLARAAAADSQPVAWYTDAVSTFWHRGDDGSWELRDRLELFGIDFDRGLLATDNYIPLLTLMVRRDDFLDAGGFDRELDLFEDWDFLLRLSERGDFVRIPQLTCEVRHFAGSDSILLQTTAELSRIVAGKSKIWARHRRRIDDATIATSIELQKRRYERIERIAAERHGQTRHLQLDVDRLEREKRLLIEELGTATRSVAENLARAEASEEHLRSLETELRGELERLGQTLQEVWDHNASLEETAGSLGASVAEKDQLIGRLYGEIERLGGVLETIYGSKSWRLHQFVERLKGRG